MTLTDSELFQAQEYIFHRLPWVLERDPAFSAVVESIVAAAFPRREEFARLVDEVVASRQEQRTGFAQSTSALMDSDIASMAFRLT